MAQVLACGVIWAAAAAGLRASDAPEGDVRLRETLRSTMLQLNDAQSQLATLQAAQAAQADERKTLSEQVAQLTKRSVEDQAARAKEIDTLKAKLADQQAETARLQQQLAQWKAGAEKTGAELRAAATQHDADRVRVVTLERKVEDLSAKNAELFRIGSEILERYEKFSLGAQFLAREPFVGRARVELENQIQDYDDKLMDQKDNP